MIAKFTSLCAANPTFRLLPVECSQLLIYNIWAANSSLQRRNLWIPYWIHSHRYTIRNTPWSDAWCTFTKLNDSIFLPYCLPNATKNPKTPPKLKYTPATYQSIWVKSPGLRRHWRSSYGPKLPRPGAHLSCIAGVMGPPLKNCAWSRQIAFAQWLEGSTSCRAGRRWAWPMRPLQRSPPTGIGPLSWL
jgi:hypothetical protein